ncbi:hypothetical protein [Pseudomonas kuykendallii]|uniref:Uncharacterized protein n=1 Tax=Pseudomonas kuykendallii TaxID=1007099 RepID=A0A2W5CXQ6_9PSED|nr:hypothetical protein [Pseudomonas kuykendallii]PZP22274.1 MAG: hypothetical protein DI599_15870 [Pseudomonas kuykendallii]
MAEEYDRQRLLDDVWREPVLTVAPRYGLSDTGLKKLCPKLQIPTPSRGVQEIDNQDKRLNVFVVLLAANDREPRLG